MLVYNLASGRFAFAACSCAHAQLWNILGLYVVGLRLFSWRLSAHASWFTSPDRSSTRRSRCWACFPGPAVCHNFGLAAAPAAAATAEAAAAGGPGLNGKVAVIACIVLLLRWPPSAPGARLRLGLPGRRRQKQLAARRHDAPADSKSGAVYGDRIFDHGGCHSAERLFQQAALSARLIPPCRANYRPAAGWAFAVEPSDRAACALLADAGIRPDGVYESRCCGRADAAGLACGTA